MKTLKLISLFFSCSLLYAMTTACSKYDDVTLNNESPDVQALPGEASANGTTKGGSNTVTSVWCLACNFWTGYECVGCAGGWCDCSDPIDITAENGVIADDLDDAIAAGTVDDFFAPANESTYLTLFPYMCGKILDDLRSGYTTLRVARRTTSIVQYYVVVAATGNSPQYPESANDCD